jgi:hypothetical protein
MGMTAADWWARAQATTYFGPLPFEDVMATGNATTAPRAQITPDQYGQLTDDQKNLYNKIQSMEAELRQLRWQLLESVYGPGKVGDPTN